MMETCKTCIHFECESDYDYDFNILRSCCLKHDKIIDSWNEICEDYEQAD